MLQSWGVRPHEWHDIPHWSRQYMLRHWVNTRQKMADGQEGQTGSPAGLTNMEVDTQSLPNEVTDQL